MSKDLERQPLDVLQPLFERARAGDESARWELVQSFEPLIISVAVKRHAAVGLKPGLDNGGIDEVRFETLVTSLEKFDRFDGELRQFPAWIRTIGWRIGSRVLKRRLGEKMQLTALDGVSAADNVAGFEEPGPESEIEQALEIDALRRCVDRLAEVEPELVDLLRLHYRDGRSSEEIAAIARHNLDPSGIRRKIRKARTLVRRCLEGGRL